MIHNTITSSIALIGLFFATITDLKTREVPDWLSYGLICSGLGLNLLFSFIYSNYWFIINSIIGFLVFLIFALVMFYAGQWGGGDSKVIMGLGALIGLNIKQKDFPMLISFFTNMLLLGSIYGLTWSLTLIFKNKKKVWKEFRRTLHSKKATRMRMLAITLVVTTIILGIIIKETIYKIIMIVLLITTIATFYLWAIVKAIEKVCMIKEVTPHKLTEGDWIAKEIRYKGKYICGPKDLGIEKSQIRMLIKLYKKKKIKKVTIKEGIPFVPSFFIAFIVTILFGNILFLII